MKNDVGMACQKVCKQGRDESIKVKVNVHGRYIILERLKHMHKQQAVFVSVFTCKVLCFAETGSIRDGEARLSVMLTIVIKIAHLVLRT